MMGTTPLARPDHLMIGLFFDKSSRTHLRTIVGHYSEFLSDHLILDRELMAQKEIDFGGQILVLLHNMVKPRSVFKDFLMRYNTGMNINFPVLSRALDDILEYYRLLNTDGKPLFPVKSSIYQESIAVRHALKECFLHFRFGNTSSNPIAPIQLGPFLQEIENRYRRVLQYQY